MKTIFEYVINQKIRQSIDCSKFPDEDIIVQNIKITIDITDWKKSELKLIKNTKHKQELFDKLFKFINTLNKSDIDNYYYLKYNPPCGEFGETFAICTNTKIKLNNYCIGWFEYNSVDYKNEFCFLDGYNWKRTINANIINEKIKSKIK